MSTPMPGTLIRCLASGMCSARRASSRRIDSPSLEQLDLLERLGECMPKVIGDDPILECGMCMGDDPGSPEGNADPELTQVTADRVDPCCTGGEVARAQDGGGR
ncbi:MAG: hypothetical protein ACE5JR_14050 [Gemmatimonadota bacterium]